ncbi:hypothetical protein GGR25_004399 [Kaistia hirudinis]|uniref:Uncharacterized protein n=1 Tax=Kaistia hirudinis TaxID=1293440 RepID=A0A840AYN7_9HYPH|nr:hypothetical protein [Kaistia hirudinis]
MSKINMKVRPAMIIAARTIEPRGAGRLTPPATWHHLG